MSVEVSWFAALCDDDHEYLGVSDPALRSSWEHCRGIALAAEEAGFGNLRFGYRAHVIVRETEAEARVAARRLVSKLDPAVGERIRARSPDSGSAGVAAQVALRDRADEEGYAEPNLWTGIGRARSGAGAAIVGDPDQVLAKLHAYRELGIESFILSGYPHRTEADLFARHVLPRLDHAPLRFQGRCSSDVPRGSPRSRRGSSRT
jgi:alkanesulfonate monooxygenase